MTTEHTTDTNQHDRVFEYNALGDRVSLETGLGTIDYEYWPNSSRLMWFTGMGDDTLFYDVLGNLTRDESRDLTGMCYDYRNLLVFTYCAPNEPTGDLNKIYCSYDNAGRRIAKSHNYQYWTEDCGGGGVGDGEDDDIDGPGGSGVEDGGKLCLKWAYNRTYYLYDAGILVATFDDADSVREMFVNGPGGALATYRYNHDDKLYYTLKDHLGSSRVLMHLSSDTANPEVAEYFTYYPYGGTLESWGNYPTPYQFTGKERDDHTSFDFDYFGARYYDTRTGTFTSIDKFGQFANGFVYCGNNPVLMIDRDGNFAWFIPVIAAVIGGSANVASNWDNIDSFWDGAGYFGIGAGQGAVSCFGPGFAAAAGTVAGGANAAMAGGGLGNILTAGGIGGVASLAGFGGGRLAGSAFNSLGLGGPPVLQGLVGGAVGGAAGGFTGGVAAGLLSGQSFNDALSTGYQAMGTGAAFGGVAGFASASMMAHSKGVNPFTGRRYAQPEPAVSQEYTVQQGRAKGLAGEARFAQEVRESGGRILSKNVKLELDGRYMFMDRVIETRTGMKIWIEVKTGPTASPQRAQPFIIKGASEGAYVTPRGNNAINAGYTPGESVQITVYIIYYDKY